MIKFKHILTKNNTNLLKFHKAHFSKALDRLKNILADPTVDNLEFETPEERELRYEDECFYFEKEWKKLQNEKVELHQDYMSPDLSEHQQRQVDIISNKFVHLNFYEQEYFLITLKEQLDKCTGAKLEYNNMFDKKRKTKVDLDIPDLNPNFEPTQDILSILTPFITSGYFSGGVSATQITSEVSKEEKKTTDETKSKESDSASAAVILKELFFRTLELI